MTTSEKIQAKIDELQALKTVVETNDIAGKAQFMAKNDIMTVGKAAVVGLDIAVALLDASGGAGGEAALNRLGVLAVFEALAADIRKGIESNQEIPEDVRRLGLAYMKAMRTTAENLPTTKETPA